MGVHASCFAGLAAAGLTVNLGGQAKRESLSVDYFLGTEISRGTFGVVHSCTRRRTGEEFAVKRVSRRPRHAGASAGCLEREAGMLRRLAHPCVVELHQVYSNKDFVDMVFSIYRGGDVTRAAQRHWHSQGDIPMPAIQHLIRQMCQGIEWLHRNGVVHRDVKGDNFLLDRPELAHPECRVCLSDFGTAVEVGSSERLQEQCGTQLYWAPEVFGRSYGLKVDVWAAGVVMHALAARRFPFVKPEQVRAQSVQVPSRCAEAGGSFLLGALERGEEERMSASEALEHPFLASVGPALPFADAPSEAAAWPQLEKRSGGGVAAPSRSDEAATATPCSSGSDERRLQYDGSMLDGAATDGAATFALVPSFAWL